MFRSRAKQIKMTPQGRKKKEFDSLHSQKQRSHPEIFVCVCLISASLPGTESCRSRWKVDSVAALWHCCQASSVHDGCGRRGQADHCVTEQTTGCHAPRSRKHPPLPTAASYILILENGLISAKNFYVISLFLSSFVILVRIISYMCNHNNHRCIIYQLLLFIFEPWFYPSLMVLFERYMRQILPYFSSSNNLL